MTILVTNRTDTLEKWRLNLNSVANIAGDPLTLYTSDGSDTFTLPTTGQLTATLNDLNSRKVKRSGDTIASLVVTGVLSTSSITLSGQLTSSIAIGTAPFVVTSTTPVANLSIGGNAATATKSTNLSGGLLGSLPIQSAANTTIFLSLGTANNLLTVNGAASGLEYKTITSTGGTVSVSYSAGIINLEASGVSGGTTFTGDLNVGTSPAKFTVLAASGNTSTLGTFTVSQLSQLANISVGASKLTVDSATGNLVSVGSLTSASLSISGTASIATASITNSTVTGITSFGSISDITVSSLTTTTTTVNQVLGSFNAAAYRSAEFIIQAVDATGLKYHSATIKVIHDGTLASSVEYAATYTANGLCGTFSADISTGNLRLLVTPATINSTVFKVTAILTKV